MQNSKALSYETSEALKAIRLTGDKYWRYSRRGMPRNYPKSVKSIFKGFKRQPDRIDAAVQWYDGRSYVFAGQEYYRLNEWKVLRAAHTYPRETANWWFGCDGLKHVQK